MQKRDLFVHDESTPKIDFFDHIPYASSCNFPKLQFHAQSIQSGQKNGEENRKLEFTALFTNILHLVDWNFLTQLIKKYKFTHGQSIFKYSS